MSKAGGSRRKDEYWTHVKEEKDGKLSCIHCGKLFSGNISVTRIRAHVNKEEGKGVAPCSFNRHNEGVHNNMASGSSHPQEPVNTVGSIQVAEGVPESIGTSICGSISHQSNAEIIHLPEEGAPHRINSIVVSGSINPDIESDGLQKAEGVTEVRCIRSASESEIRLLNQLDLDLQCEESDIIEQQQWMESLGKKRKPGVDQWMDELQKLKKRAVDMNNLGGVEIKQLIQKMQKHKEEKPVTLSTEFVGWALDVNIKKVFKLLEDEQAFVIGIYGMGGVGKTSLVTHVETEVKRKGTFKNVFWVTVPHSFSISRLQHDIAKRMGIKLEEDDERIRAANLSEALKTKEKSILILDDVWKYIDLQKVGIPLKEIGVKVILTTRLKHVCQQMNCLPNGMIQMFPLESHEAEELFKVKLGHNGTPATLPPEVQKIARSVVQRCDGLPLGITVMARIMKGLNDIHHWRHARNKLEELEIEEEVEEVFKVLKRSYDNLMGKNLQECFLYCALLTCFDRDEKIMKLVDSGLINGRRSLEEIFDEGNIILDELEAHSLLGRTVFDLCTTHRLVIEMVCHILKESQRYVMVKSHQQGLTKIPHMQEWTAELVHLIRCDIEEIPKSTSPSCPRLSSLIMTGYGDEYFGVSHIPECFLEKMSVLVVLDLSFNVGLESLPNSLSRLRSLVSLVVKGCCSLEYVPPLGELQALSRLVISCCSIKKIPEGLEMLINLKWLDLSCNENLTLEPGSVLPKLTNLQYLDLRGCPFTMITLEDVEGMKMLECFGGTFLSSNYMQKVFDTDFGPKTYHLCFGNWRVEDDGNLKVIVPGDPNTVSFKDCQDFSGILPTDLTNLAVCDNNQWVCLCDALSFDAAAALRSIEVDACKKLKSMFCLSGSCSFCTNITGLKNLCLAHLESLTIFCKDVADVGQSLSPGGTFSRLKDFDISECHAIEKLLSPLVLQLLNLETMTVSSCNSMKEIFAVSNGDDDDGSHIMLPKLTRLKLRNLPQLKTVCQGIISCGSSPRLEISVCPNLEWDPTIQFKPFDDSNIEIYQD